MLKLFIFMSCLIKNNTNALVFTPKYNISGFPTFLIRTSSDFLNKIVFLISFLSYDRSSKNYEARNVFYNIKKKGIDRKLFEEKAP